MANNVPVVVTGIHMGNVGLVDLSLGLLRIDLMRFPQVLAFWDSF